MRVKPLLLPALLCVLAVSSACDLQQGGPKPPVEHSIVQSKQPEPTIMGGPKLKQSVEVTNSIGMRLVLIPAGEFPMGSPEADKEAEPSERPQHLVRITQPYYLAQWEVTRGQYSRYATLAKETDEGRKDPGFANDDPHPVVEVSWEDASKFCEWLSVKEGKRYRLPTEAEWEYACRAGTTTPFGHGDDPAKLGEYAWFGGNAQGMTHPVGEKRANEFGLYDMLGNVFEWCGDWESEKYYEEVAKSLAIDPTGPAAGLMRIARGGCWGNSAPVCRPGVRNAGTPDARTDQHGFRVLLVPPGL